MQQTNEFFMLYAEKINDAETEGEATDLSNELYDIAFALKTLRNHLPFNKHPDLAYALDADLEHYEALAAKLCDNAKDAADDRFRLQAEIQTYGTYEEQVRQTYYGGQL